MNIEIIKKQYESFIKHSKHNSNNNKKMIINIMIYSIFGSLNLSHHIFICYYLNIKYVGHHILRNLLIEIFLYCPHCPFQN